MCESSRFLRTRLDFARNTEIVRKRMFRADRGKESRVTAGKGGKDLTTPGEIPEHASLRDTVYLNWGSTKWGDTTRR